MKIHSLGFPRIGKERELKKALEQYWKEEISENSLNDVAKKLREERLYMQSGLDFIPVNDFSLYDHILDTSILLGIIPERFQTESGGLDQYFRMARGLAPIDAKGEGVPALEMTKWFDTNYHYLVPEFTKNSQPSLNAEKLLSEIKEAQDLLNDPKKCKPVLVGPLTFLRLGKEKDESDKKDLIAPLTELYAELFRKLAKAGIDWIQCDEPILATDLEPDWQNAFKAVYKVLSSQGLNILLTSYFGSLEENISLLAELPVHGVHLDAIRGKKDIDVFLKLRRKDQVLSLGVVDGRNIWKSDIVAILDFLEPLKKELNDALWIAPSCSLLHVPISLENEVALKSDIKNWLSFAKEKIEELVLIKEALEKGRSAVQIDLDKNQKAIESRKKSGLVHNRGVQEKLSLITEDFMHRKMPYEKRAALQKQLFNLPLFPTTTIGSFPQTKEIRANRYRFKKGEISEIAYKDFIKNEIKYVIQRQEEIGLDVLVHGEAERNDMVEYFGERLNGFAFTQGGWVQSYGSRCVKPPIIFGDISRPEPITVEWSVYAQSLSEKPVKGMLTGPVTILNWSFVRDDQERAKTCRQIALAIREEVLDLEKSGIRIIQIDEAALREGLPLRKRDWQSYLDWAIGSYKISANGVTNQTQIHTHMCYSEFNDIISAIAEMDADVITIEASRSDMKLLDAFDAFKYPNAIGPGLYDIHSPKIPSIATMEALLQAALKKIPKEKLWINPDCGLKTRHWEEVIPALENMVALAKKTRENSSS